MKAFSTRTRRWTIAASTGLFIVGLATLGQVDAGEVVDGNPTCDSDFEFKQEDPSGTITIDRDGLHLTMTVGTHPDVEYPNTDNAVVSRTVHTDSEVTTGQVIVKGGNGAIIYSFGEDLPWHAPENSSGKWPTISHVQVCWDEPEEPEYGRIELTKDVVGAEDTDEVFVLCITGPGSEGDEVCQKAKAGDTVTFDELAPGTYAVSEEDPGGNWTVTYSDTTLTVVADGLSSATVTNTWTEEPEHGRIVVTKVVEGREDVDRTFEVCITGPAPDDTEQCENVGPAMPATFEKLDPGEYTVRETDPGSNWTVTYSDETVTVVADQTASATITNTWTEEPEYGRIEVTKVVTGAGAPTDTEFEVCITGPAPGTTEQCEEIEAGEKAVFDELDFGTYAVTETRTGLATNWTVTGEGNVVVDSTDTEAATITNTWTRTPQYGRIEVAKVVTGAGAPTDAEFEVCITGPAPATTKVCKPVEAGEKTVFEKLDFGTYAVTETRTGLASNWTVSGEGNVVVDSTEAETITVTNTWAAQEQLPPVTPPANPPVTPPANPPTSVSPSGGSLPTTGGDTTLALTQAGIAGALLAAGSVLLRLSRRPGTTTS